MSRLVDSSNWGNYQAPLLNVGRPPIQAIPSAEVYHLGGGADYRTVRYHRSMSSSSTALDAFEQNPQNGAMNNSAADPLLPGGDVDQSMAMMGFLYRPVELGSAGEDYCMPSAGYTY